MAPMPQRGHQPASTRLADNSPVHQAFLSADTGGFGDGIAAGSPEALREAHKAASDKVWPVSHAGGAHVTTTGSLAAGPRMTCSKCGASAAVLVNDPGSPGHEICVSCSHCEELAYPAPGEIIPQTKDPLYPSAAMIEGTQ
jgi:hypothetical protein